MDSSFTVKSPRPGASRLYAPRDPVLVHEAVETELEKVAAVAATADGGTRRNPHRDDERAGKDRPDQPPQDIVDAASRDVIYRERDVQAAERQHPDQALLRERAYRQSPLQTAPAAAPEPHANIKA